MTLVLDRSCEVSTFPSRVTKIDSLVQDGSLVVADVIKASPAIEQAINRLSDVAPWMLGHLEREAKWACILTWTSVRVDKDLRSLEAYVAGYFHDIGKAIWPERLLNGKEPMPQFLDVVKLFSRGHFEEAQFWMDSKALIRRHPLDGANLVADVSLNVFSQWTLDRLRILRGICEHHEDLNGNGYPGNRAGIPALEMGISHLGRVLRIVDTFDAMVYPRPYQSAVTIDQAFTTLRKGCNTIFDPNLVSCFCNDNDIREFLSGMATSVPANY